MNTIQEPTALFVVRCQPGLHYGHLDALKQVIAQGIKNIIIGVGSANEELTVKNPWTYDERVEMIKKSSLDLDANITVAPIPDFGNNEKWKQYILDTLPPFDTILSGNPWVAEAFHDAGKKIFVPKINNIIKSTHLRDSLKEGNFFGLFDKIPQPVIDYLKEIKSTQRLRDIEGIKVPITPKVSADIVIFDDDDNLILIDRGAFPFGYALPGGFVDIGERVKQAAVREAQEELGIDVEIIAPLSIQDDPLRDPRGQTITHPFYCKVVGGTIAAGDDAKDFIRLKVTKPSDLDAIQFAFADHKDIILEALTHK